MSEEMYGEFYNRARGRVFGRICSLQNILKIYRKVFKAIAGQTFEGLLGRFPLGILGKMSKGVNIKKFNGILGKFFVRVIRVMVDEIHRMLLVFQ